MWPDINRIFSRKGSSPLVYLGVGIFPEGISVAVIDREAGGQPAVKTSAFFACVQSEWVSVLESFCRQHGVKGAKTYVAFHPDYYELMLIDAPEVPDEELAEAVKWRVKDFINGDIESYVVDAFRLPQDAYRGRMNMIYAAYMKKEVVVAVVELCGDCGLELVSIGISELARVNLIQGRKEYADLGVAFLHLGEQKGQIDLIENGYLYLSRGIDSGYAMLKQASAAVDSGATGRPSGLADGGLNLVDHDQGASNSNLLDGLVLDVQRSLDYYESQLGKSGISKLLLLTPAPLSAEVYKNLSANLPVKVEALHISDLLDCEQDCSGFMDSCSVAVGAALGGIHAAA
ncbi:MAG: hypothetical protein CSA49_05320 [Gammaproteobacteria bacterium]|nr:MAG: hypothetical protein CSA49_05320 [Gammaproteobacteria bacterium]